ncbi:MAG TPA: amidase [Solirubrobacteraceae bacterium]|nr:amidase [Solirubrobacteraceae bacterium]
MTDLDPTASELWAWPASVLTDAIGRREVSCTEVVTACLTRIETVNPAVNALVEVHPERALELAAAADRAPGHGPLHGVPISIKDNVDERGLPNSGGITAAAGAPVAGDAPVVRNLSGAGAISVGRSNVPAFSLRWFSENEVYGRTVNPWNASRTPGGSSGGAAAAVATGMVPIAHGNDIGGSVRYPAHVCGVMGLRPTVGRIPSWDGPSEQVPGLPPSPLLMAVEGVLARTARDLALGLTAMAVPDLRDPACVPAPFLWEPTLAHGATLGLIRGGEGAPVDATHLAALDAAAAALSDAGFVVEELAVPQLAEAHRLWVMLLYEDLRGLLPAVHALGGEQIVGSLQHGYTLQEQMWGRPDLEMYVGGHVRRTALISEMQSLLERYPVIVMPAAGAATPEHGADLEWETAAPLMASQWPSSAVPLLGLPGLTLPTGVGDDGLPTGVQLLGARFGESALLDAAQAIADRIAPITPINPRTFDQEQEA